MNSTTTYMMRYFSYSFFFFFNDTATTEIYTLSLHDALPICLSRQEEIMATASCTWCSVGAVKSATDRKSTRLNSSHSQISYAVFCLKKKKKNEVIVPMRHTHTLQLD